ncbi:hypothetical protein A3Q56_00033 [Intoshia linei]|uniref:BTB domain-containing protein n=1 Tax=Intoshia linei TaxID=1819745 RepID=A0A177BD53_9BILA|nr:hypothetical protein A3Q56_00033 [Intoshia linei]
MTNTFSHLWQNYPFDMYNSYINKKEKSNDRVIINVGGVRHETYKSTLRKIPATRLSRLTEALGNYDPELNEYFFDRHPGVFENILNYYRCGKLHYPTDVCGPLFENELDYWGLDPDQVEPCCWMTYTKHRDTKDIMLILDKLDIDDVKITRKEAYKKFKLDNSKEIKWWNKIRPIIWLTFEEQYSSYIARIIYTMSISFILLSIITFCLKTENFMKVNSANHTNVNSTLNNTLSTVKSRVYDYSHIIEYICNSWFTLELMIRLFVCPSQLQFLKQPHNIIDFVATASFYIDIILRYLDKRDSIVELLSIIRILRLFKLTRRSPGIKILIHTFSASAHELSLLIFVLLLG